MIIGYLYRTGNPIFPIKTYSPLIINSDLEISIFPCFETCLTLKCLFSSCALTSDANRIKKHQTEQNEKGHYHVERTYGNFRRELTLPSDVDIENIEAACTKGVLSITLPKTKKAKPFKVKVKGQ